MTKNKHFKLTKLIYPSFIITSLIYILPFLMTNKAIYGMDLYFHIDRMISLSTIWDSPINFRTFYNVGQGVNLFYPWLTLYPFYLLFKIRKSIYSAFIIYLFILTLVTHLIAFIAAKNISRSRKVGYIFAILYSFSTYRLDNILTRFALGEVIAFTFLPLVFLGIYEIGMGNYRKWPILTVGMSLVLYSHILSTVLSVVVLLLIVLISLYFWSDKMKRILALSKAAVTTLFVTCFVWLPMLEQYHQLKIESPKQIVLSDYTKSLGDILIESINNSITAHVIGLVALILLIWGIVKFKELGQVSKFSLFLSLLIILFTTDFMPWNMLGFLRLDIIQYPYRFVIYASMLIYFVGSYLLEKSTRYTLVFLSFVLVILHIGSSMQSIRSYATVDPVKPREFSSRNDLQTLTHSFYQTDYANAVAADVLDKIDKDSVRKQNFEHVVYVDNLAVDADYNFQEKQATFSFKTTSDSSIVRLPIYHYLGQQVTDNEQLVNSSVSKYGNTEINLPAGDHKVTVFYHYTAIAKVARLISIISSILLIIIILYRNVYGKRLKDELFF